MNRTRNPRGVVSRAPNLTPARCYPSLATVQCESCSRWVNRYTPTPNDRPALVIDGSVLKNDGGCLMFAPVLCSAECREAA